MGGRVAKVRGNAVRAITHGPTGQQCECWLPAGLWQEHGECDVVVYGERAKALIVRKPVPLKQDGTWYVSPVMWAAVK